MQTETDQPVLKKRKARKITGEDYVNNAEFSSAVSDYVKYAKLQMDAGFEVPMVPDYIANCFIKICNGLSRAPSFMTYSWREDMVMDAVENCLKAILNYDENKPTRTGKPNPFSYFTQITYFAFLRRIAKENKQLKIKQNLRESGGIGTFADFDENLDSSNMIGETMVERIRQKNDAFYKVENELAPIFEISKPKRMTAKRSAKKEANPLDAFLDSFNEDV